MVCSDSFIDCETIQLSGSQTGLFTISFDYYSVEETLSSLNSVSFSVNNQTYVGFVLSHQIKKMVGVPPSAECFYWIHSLQISATSSV